MQADEGPIAIANTFTKLWEMLPYFELAEKWGYRVHTLVTENRHESTNIHGVPDDILLQMRNRFEVQL